jgi:hypothetical protein
LSNYPLVFDSLKWSRIKLKFMSPTKLLKNLFESVTVSKNKNPNSNNGWRNVFLFLSKIVFMQQGYFSPLHMYQECDCNVDRYFLVYFLLRWMYCCQSVVENWIPIICRSVFSRFFQPFSKWPDYNPLTFAPLYPYETNKHCYDRVIV